MKNYKEREYQIHGISFAEIARRLGVKRSSVTLVNQGKRTSSRIKEELINTIERSRRLCPVARFEIFIDDTHIDTVYFDTSLTAKEVRKILIEEEGLNEDISAHKVNL